MFKRPLPPYGRELLIPPFPFLKIFVNEPECWERCAQERCNGFKNNLCLPDIKKAGDYRWPVRNLSVIVITYGPVTFEDCQHLVNVLGSYEPSEIVVRHWPDTAVVSFQEDVA